MVVEGRALKVAASRASTPAELVEIRGIEAALLTAAGVSDKAARHLRPQDKAEAVQGLIRNFLEPVGAAFVEELIFRFLLTRGDTLGGSMRNIGGGLAQRKFTSVIIATLNLSGDPFYWLHADSQTWLLVRPDDVDIESSLKGLGWSSNGESRTLIYNLNVPIVGNNVDLCLFNCDCLEISRGVYSTPERYIALGELKGGIDPAGADEHWKTARTALVRIRTTFSAQSFSPNTFFVGGAIASAMAGEIWEQLESGILNNAANLTSEGQIASLCSWLVNL